MSTSGPIPGWHADPASGGGDPATRSISGRLSEAWELYRAHAGPLLAISLLFQGIFGLPLAVASYTSITQMLGLFSGTINWLDPGAVESMLAVGPFGDVALDYAFLGVTIGLSFLAYALALATTTVMLASHGHERWQLGPALRATFSHGLGIVLAGLVFMVAAGAVFWLQGTTLARQLRYDSSDPFGLDASGGALGVSLLVLVLEIVALYCYVRWVAAIGVLVVEGRTLRASLRRSSELTRGRRRWIAGHLFVAGLLLAVMLLIVEYLPAFVVGSAFGVGSPVFAFVLGALVVAVPTFAVPPMLIVLAALFRDLRDAGPKPAPERVDAPAGWGRGG